MLEVEVEDGKDDPNSITKKLERMEKRITRSVTRSIEKMIAKALKPLKDDIKLLSASRLEQDKKMLDVTRISKENKELKHIVEEVKSENMALKDRLNRIENKLLENNFVILGVTEESWETYSALQEKVYQLIAYTVNAQDPAVQLEKARKARLVKVTRLGSYSKYRGRPISVQFEHHSAAQYFWDNKGYLPEGIYVKREFTAETEKHRRILKPVYNAAKKSPNYKGKCRMEENYLVIKGKKYGLHNLKDLPDELSDHKVTSRNTDLVLGFFGELHPLSNFHHCRFTIDGIEFSSSEQHIQYTKACYFENMELAGRILGTQEPLECKVMAKEIKYPVGKGRWSDVAKTTCYNGLKEKFVQNENLKNFLIHTGTRTIVECSVDKLWGTGIPIHVKNCLDPRTWTSQGLLGELLTRIRAELQADERISSSNQGTLV